LLVDRNTQRWPRQSELVSALSNLSGTFQSSAHLPSCAGEPIRKNRQPWFGERPSVGSWHLFPAQLLILRRIPVNKGFHRLTVSQLSSSLKLPYGEGVSTGQRHISVIAQAGPCQTGPNFALNQKL